MAREIICPVALVKVLIKAGAMLATVVVTVPRDGGLNLERVDNILVLNYS